MKAHHLLDRIGSLQQTLNALSITVAARHTAAVDDSIKEQTPPDDDWSPSGFAAFHLEYLATSMHRLADELTAVAQRPPSDSEGDQPDGGASDGWKPEARALGHLDYVIAFLDQVVVAIETDHRTEAANDPSPSN